MPVSQMKIPPLIIPVKGEKIDYLTAKDTIANIGDRPSENQGETDEQGLLVPSRSNEINQQDDERDGGGDEKEGESN